LGVHGLKPFVRYIENVQTTPSPSSLGFAAWLVQELRRGNRYLASHCVVMRFMGRFMKIYVPEEWLSKSTVGAFCAPTFCAPNGTFCVLGNATNDGGS